VWPQEKKNEEELRKEKKIGRCRGKFGFSGWVLKFFDLGHRVAGHLVLGHIAHQDLKP
jgi:hypothetical protein